MADVSITSSSQPLPALDIPRPFEALSDVSNDSTHNGRDGDSQEAPVVERLSQPPFFSGSTVLIAPSIDTSFPGLAVQEGPQDKSASSCNKSRKKLKKHKEKSKDRGKDRDRVQEKERKSRKTCVPELNKVCEMNRGNLKNNSIPHKSTGESLEARVDIT